MGQSEFIAALDLGSSKIIAMAGKKNEQGMLTVIASEKTESDACIRRGCVHNVEETGQKIRVLINKLNRNVNISSPIDKIYVNVGGQSLHTETFVASKEVNGAVVNEEILQSLFDESQAYEPEFGEILDVVSPEYYLDGRLEQNPKGIQCTKIEARFKLIVGRPLLKRTLKKSIEEKANLPVAGYIVGPIATATAVLNETEKELGCALIELGAGVTSLSVYKNGLLRYLTTIPLGGKVVTKDICDLNILEKEAEDLKINFGSALIEFDDDSVKAQTAKLAEGFGNGHSREVDLNELNNIIEARVDEILANVVEQINISGYAGQLTAGVIVSGGGAAMKNIAESIQTKTGMSVRLAAVKKTLVNQAVDWALDYSNAEVIGLLALGQENCAKPVEKTFRPVEQPVQVSFFTDEEVPVVKPENRPTRQLPGDKKNTNAGEKQGSGFFKKLTKRFDNITNSLFEEDNDNDKEE